MKKILSSILLAAPLMLSAQGAIDAYSVSQPDLKGTARYMSMAGAFGALGGDLSAINSNPGGIGVYRSSDLGITFNLDLQSVESTSKGVTSNVEQTKFTVNNFGYVGAFRMDSEIMPFVNFGISYNRPVSYNRRYSGKISDLNRSLSNYVANISNAQGYNSDILSFYEEGGEVLYDPYIDSPCPQWLSIMAYNSFLINPQTFDANGIGSNFTGLMNANTRGYSEYEVIEEGGIDEFNINLGGNLADILYWGIGVGVSNMDQNRYTYYGEALTGATVPNQDETALENDGTASFGLENSLNTSGNGWNFKFGVILKPINELRIGASIHTPTYWSLTDNIFSSMNYAVETSDGGCLYEGTEDANAGYIYENSYKIRTPWKCNLSVATILGTKGIISFDYERVAYNDMKVEYYDYDFNTYYEDNVVKNDIGSYYKAMNIYRVGAEYRVSPQFSLRLGYAYYSSPVNDDVLNGNVSVNTAGTMPAYTLDRTTEYITGGFGYRYKGFYTDFAYVHKSRESEYKAFSPEMTASKAMISSPGASLKDNNNQVVWSIGYRF